MSPPVTLGMTPQEERRALIVLLSVIYLMIAGFGLAGAAFRRRQGVQAA